MTCPDNLQIESKQIGTAPQVVAPPELAGRVIYATFDVPSARSLPGGVPVTEFLAELESDSEMAPRLSVARRQLADAIDNPGTFRHLRLRAGLSQARLASLASTTQTYIARVESGTLDPGTDMLARLAIALGVDEVTVFSSVRSQRSQKRAKHVG